MNWLGAPDEREPLPFRALRRYSVRRYRVVNLTRASAAYLGHVEGYRYALNHDIRRAAWYSARGQFGVLMFWDAR